MTVEFLICISSKSTPLRLVMPVEHIATRLLERRGFIIVRGDNAFQ